MSSDQHHADDHGHAHDDSHGAHATEAIPESSPQDLILKAVTLAAAVVLIGSGWWWSMQPLPERSHEAGHEQSHEAGSGEHTPSH